MTVKRLEGIPGIAIDRVAAAAGNDPEVLRLENLDTDLVPPAAAIAATQSALTDDNANSYLPFTGSVLLRNEVAQHLNRLTGHSYTTDEVVITAGGTEGLLDALLATTDPGDEVILTDPTYAGMIYRVKLAGAIPRLVPFQSARSEWRLDLDALHSAVNNKTRAMFIMNPSMPSGAVLNQEEWTIIANICEQHSLWFIYNAAMERILFDGRRLIHPVTLPGMRDRTIIVGSVSKEYRMIGWRIGWVVGPASIMSDVALVCIYNVAGCPGISQAGAAAALKSPLEEFALCIQEWEKRRDIVLEQLNGLSIVPAAGGWSMLLNVKELGYDSFSASRLLLERGKVAATPMKDWGKRNSDQFVRLVFSNEPVQRLSTLKERFKKTFSHS
jgi:N-succinyldiaminopimelate aminotransferase